MEHEFEQEFRMLGLKIAYYRKVKNLTQEQLAEKLVLNTLELMVKQIVQNHLQ